MGAVNPQRIETSLKTHKRGSHAGTFGDLGRSRWINCGGLRNPKDAFAARALVHGPPVPDCLAGSFDAQCHRSPQGYHGCSMKLSRITKVAIGSLVGFCAVSLGADKIPLNPLASQVAGFAGAFLGSLVAQRRRKVNPTQLGKEEADGNKPAATANS